MPCSSGRSSSRRLWPESLPPFLAVIMHSALHITGSRSTSSVAVSVGSALQQRQQEEAAAKAAAEERARIQREKEEKNTKLTSNLLKMVMYQYPNLQLLTAYSEFLLIHPMTV